MPTPRTSLSSSEAAKFRRAAGDGAGHISAVFPLHLASSARPSPRKTNQFEKLYPHSKSPSHNTHHPTPTHILQPYRLSPPIKPYLQPATNAPPNLPNRRRHPNLDPPLPLPPLAPALTRAPSISAAPVRAPARLPRLSYVYHNIYIYNFERGGWEWRMEG